MTDEKAIEILKSMRDSTTYSHFVCEAIDIAIDAINRLSEESKAIVKKQDKYRKPYTCDNCGHDMLISTNSRCPFCGARLMNWVNPV